MPKAKLTKSFVERTPFTSKGQVAYCDTELPGFYLIVGMQSKSYVAQKDVRGRSVRCTIGRHGPFTAEEARKIAKDKLYLMAQGINPNEQDEQERAKVITLATVFESYLTTRRNLKQRTKDDYRYIINRYLDDWQGRLITDVTKDMVGARHARIAEEHGKYTANMY